VSENGSLQLKLILASLKMSVCMGLADLQIQYIKCLLALTTCISYIVNYEKEIITIKNKIVTSKNRHEELGS
jgi:hypothetical protein